MDLQQIFNYLTKSAANLYCVSYVEIGIFYSLEHEIIKKNKTLCHDLKILLDMVGKLDITKAYYDKGWEDNIKARMIGLRAKDVIEEALE